MLGFSMPVPSAIRIRPGYRKIPLLGIAREAWPSMISTPPQNTDRRSPSTLSATQPPGSDIRYTEAA